MGTEANLAPKPRPLSWLWWALATVGAFSLTAGTTWLAGGGWRVITSRPAHGQVQTMVSYRQHLLWPSGLSLRPRTSEGIQRAYPFSWVLLSGDENWADQTPAVLPPAENHPVVLSPALTTLPLAQARRQYRPWLRPVVPLLVTFPRLSPSAWSLASLISRLYVTDNVTNAAEAGGGSRPSLAISGEFTAWAVREGSWRPSLPAAKPAGETSEAAAGQSQAVTGSGPGNEQSSGSQPAAPGVTDANAAIWALASPPTSTNLTPAPLNPSTAETPPAPTPGDENGSDNGNGSGSGSSETPRGRWQIPQVSLLPLSGMIRPADSYSPLPPQSIRGVYATGYLAGSERMPELIRTVHQAGLDAVVIEIKDEYGRISYDSGIPLARQIGASSSKIADVRGLLEELHREGLYVIARMVTFQDGKLAEAHPELAIHSRKGGLWRNRVGLAWVDPGLGEVWKYEVDVAEEALQLGFDEVQFDYVRFPTDGDVTNIMSVVPADQRVQAISAFLTYARQRLAPYGRPISADAFGFVATAESDLGIGQHLEEMSQPVDYVSLMVYPSHYPAGSYGFDDPDLHPYGVVRYAMQRASERVGARKQRPWLQSFSLKHPYGPAQLLDQLRAVQENGITSWLLWNAAGRYDQLRGL
ncbi:MAG: hypothetical protein IMX01_08175 [Limnochordaceae bacterium]|nr:hypothetical protein [Limnochordaceae bacterium]